MSLWKERTAKGQAGEIGRDGIEWRVGWVIDGAAKGQNLIQLFLATHRLQTGPGSTNPADRAAQKSDKSRGLAKEVWSGNVPHPIPSLSSSSSSSRYHPSIDN